MEFLRSRALMIAGILLMLGGFFYDVFFAGIPYQAATPEMIANYQHHSQISTWLIRAGLSIGVVACLLRIVVKKRSRAE